MLYVCMQIDIKIQEREYLKRVDGTFGIAPDGDLAITSLKFTTDKDGNTTTYGPYGDPDRGTPFSVPLENAGILAFFARCGKHLNALGFYAQQPYNP